MTRTQLSGWSHCEDTCDTAALVVSELVTNAIVHTASSQIVCELHDGDELVRIAVRDEGCAPGEPHPSPQRPEEEHGRGLLLIESLCRSWGAQPAGLGLLVWADLPRTAAGAERFAGAECDADLGAGFGVGFDYDTDTDSDSGSGSGAVSGSGSGSAGCDAGSGFVPGSGPASGFVPGPGSGSASDAASGSGSGSGSASGSGSGSAKAMYAYRSPVSVSDAGARSDLGWGAKKPPAEDRGESGRRQDSEAARAEGEWGRAGALGGSPDEWSRGWGRV
ncbi:ATP-binding protein [Streptomyces sp. NPDC002643]